MGECFHFFAYFVSICMYASHDHEVHTCAHSTSPFSHCLHCAECTKLEGNHQVIEGLMVNKGDYHFYHWAVTNASLLDGGTVTFTMSPCNGVPQVFVKPALLYQGNAMEQLFETVPGSNGSRTSTWPFPDNNTGRVAQGPDTFLVNGDYPGDIYTVGIWG